MRRVLVAVTLSFTLLAAAACADDAEEEPADDGAVEQPDVTAPGGEVDSERVETCTAVDTAFARLDSAEGQEVSEALFAAGESGDPDELAEAEAEYLDFAGEVAQDLADAGEATEDPELAPALAALADEFEALSADVAADPAEAESLDMAPFQNALQNVGMLCE